MYIQADDINNETLWGYGAEAAEMIKNRDFKKLADRYGYALAYGEEPALAIEKEINSCLSQAGDNAKISDHMEPKLVAKYFKKDEDQFVALVECLLSIENGVGEVLAELIVTTDGKEYSISLEQISYAA